MMDESTLRAEKIGCGSDVDQGVKHHQDERATLSSRSCSASTSTSAIRCPTIITKVQPDDVLMGRGFNVMLHTGNVRFIEIIRSRCAEYQSITSRKQKHIIAQQIVSTVRSTKGLFLRRIEYDSAAASSSDDKAAAVAPKKPGKGPSSAADQRTTESWTLVDESAILLKVKQALRDQSLVMMSKNINVKGGGNQHHPNEQKKEAKKRSRAAVVETVASSRLR